MRRALFLSIAFVTLISAAYAEDIRVPILLNKPDAVKAKFWPVTFGVPFKQGACKDLAPLTVMDEKGQSVPCQIVKTADWPDGLVRWALVDFRADFAKQYALAAGSRAETPAHMPTEFAGDRLAVRTGSIPSQAGPIYEFVEFVKGSSSFNMRLLSSHHPDLAPGQTTWTGSFYVVDSKGRRGILKAEKLAVELDGPLHRVIRLEGPYLTEKGERNAAAVVYFHFYDGLPLARISHKLIETEDTNELWFRDIGLTLTTESGGAAAAALNTSHDDLGKFTTFPIKEGEEILMVQADFPHFGSMKSSCKYGIVREAGPELTETAACGNWAEVSGFAAQVPGFAETFPKAFRIARHGKASELTIKLWASESGQELDFRTEQVIKNYFGNDWIPDNHAVTKIANNAQGTAKTHEVWLYPHAGPLDAEKIAQFGATKEEIYACADPAYVMRTGIMGALRERDVKRFPEAEAAIADYFDRLVTACHAVFPPNGYLCYGMYPFTAGNWERKKAQGDHWYPTIHRLSRCLEYNLKRGVWILYARSGDRKYHDYARRYTRWLGDMIFSNWETPARPKGWISFGEFHSPIVWGAYGADAIRNGKLGMRAALGSEGATLAMASSEDVIQFNYDYFMAGDYQSRDAALAYKQAVIQEMDWDVEKALAGFGQRPEAFLRMVGSLYELDHDPHMLELGRGMVRRLAQPGGELNEEFPASSAKWGELFGAYYYYYVSTGDAVAKDALLKMAEFQYRHGNLNVFFERSSPVLEAYALAYRETGQPIWAEYLRAAVDDYAAHAAAERKIMPNPADVNQQYTGPDWGAGAMTGQGPVDIGIPAALAVMAELDAKPRVLPFAAKLFPTQRTRLLLLKEKPGAAALEVFVNNYGDPAGHPALRDASGKEMDLVAARDYHRSFGPDYMWLNSYKWYQKYEDQIFYRLTIPATVPPGQYELDLGSEVRFVVLNSDIEKILQVAPEGTVIEQGKRSFFVVPEGAASVEYFAYRAVKIFNPAGEEVAPEDLKNGHYRFATKGISGTWAMEPARDKWLYPAVTSTEPFVKIEKVSVADRAEPYPLILANAPERLFIVATAWLKVAPKTVEMGLPTAEKRYPAPADRKLFGQSLWLANEFIEIPVPEDGAGLPAQQGTVEFWFQPQWSASDCVMDNGGPRGDILLQLFKFDPLQLIYRVQPPDGGKYGRFSEAGLEFSVNKAGHTRATEYFEAGQWYHIAMTWKVDGKDDECRLFVNGRLRAHCHYNIGMEKETPASSLLPRGKVIRLGAGHVRGAAVTTLELLDELRISRTIRYKDDFEPSKSAFQPDGDTALLMHFDGDLDGVLDGAPVTAVIKKGRLW